MSSAAVLLVQLGTPDEPTAPALRRYLRQFLGDPRVIEVPRFKWWLILNLFILPFRPARSAAKYRRIWNDKTGSPLLHITKLQTEALQKALPNVPVRFGMQIGNPPLEDVLRELIGQGVERLIVLPMYPQYSATTWASATDTLFKALMKERRVPALRIVPPYYEHPAYVPLVRHAYAAWARLEAASGSRLFLQTGGLNIGARDGALVSGALASAGHQGLQFIHVA